MNIDLGNIAEKFEEVGIKADAETAAPKVTWTFEEMMDAPEVEQAFIVPELLPAHAVAVLIGEDGIGKTQILTQLCLAVACKRTTFLQRPLIVKHGRALIVATEESRTRFTQSLRKQWKHLYSDTPYKDVGIRFTEGVNFDNYETLCAEVEKSLKEQPTDLVVIDALSDLFGLINGTINDSDHARKILKVMQIMCNTYEVTIVLIHHVPKTKMVEKRKLKELFLVKDDSQGASAITQLPRTVLALTHDRSTITGNGLSYKNFLHVVKANLMGKYFVTRALELDFEATTLTHNFQQLVNIEEYEKGNKTEAAEEGAPNIDPISERKMHEQNIIAIFANVELLTREDLVNKLKTQYNVGNNKITEKDGIIQTLLGMKLIEKENRYFKRVVEPKRDTNNPEYWRDEGAPPVPPPAAPEDDEAPF